MVLEPPESVRKLQRALQTKAKGAPGYRFYLLYDKLYRKDVLKYAYDRCKANKGAPGVDGQDFADIEAYGEERWLDELADKLHKKTYRIEAVRRVWIPKADGKKLRPLGIPRIADRVVMTAAGVVLEPIFEADMPAEQHGYRPNLSAHTAVKTVGRLINGGYTRVYRAVLQKHGLTGSMGRRGNPYDNAKAESFMKTLRVCPKTSGGITKFSKHEAD